MGLFHRKDVPPAEAMQAVGRDDRLVSWADTADGAQVLASQRGVWWPDPGGWRVVGWHLIDKAVWRDGVLSVVEAEVVDDLLLVDRPPVHARLTVPRDLPPTVRKRVQANVVRSSVEPVPGGAARFVARRVPGADGVRWWARLEPGTRPDERVRAAVTERIGELAAAWAAEVR